MITRSYDWEGMKKAIDPYPEFKLETFDYKNWVDNPNNLLIQEEDNFGFLNYEYPGAYTAHWFYTVRGKEAIELAQRMLDYCFKNYDVRLIRGLTPESNMRARIAAKRVGLTSQGMVETTTGPHELMTMTKDEFYSHLKGQENKWAA